MRSLQARLGLQLLLTLLVAFLILWLVVSSAIRGMVEGYVATRLGHDGETVLAALYVDAEGRLMVDSARIDAIYQRPFSGHYYQIFSGSDVFTSRSLWDQQLPVNPSEINAADRLYLSGPQQQPLLAVVAHYQKLDRRITLVISEDLSAIEEEIRNFQNYFSITAAIMLVMLIAASALVLRVSLRPLRRVREEVHALEHGQQDQLSVEVPSEIAPVVGEVNRLLQVLSHRLQRSRHALGNLAHALKKPLTVLQQLERDPAISANPETQKTLVTQIDSMQRIIDRELRSARLAGEGHAGIYFNIVNDVPPLVDALEKIYRHKGLQIITDVQADLVLSFDREDMLELLGNLLDNAGKWATQRTHLSLQINDEVTFTIEDDGPGVADDGLAELSRRGRRLDESVAGHGLGLAIVRDIVEQYHGHIEYARSAQLGGLQVVVTLPLGSD